MCGSVQNEEPSIRFHRQNGDQNGHSKKTGMGLGLARLWAMQGKLD